MKRIIFLAIIAIYSQCISAQHLTYSNIMAIAKIESWSKISEILNSFGYIYSGSKDLSFDNNGQTFNVRKAAWRKNCEYDIKEGVYRWKGNQKWSVFTVTCNDQGWGYEYIFPDRISYTNFISALKKNGYKQIYDSINDDGIYAQYTKKGQRAIFMVEYNDGHYGVDITVLVF